MCCKGHGKGSSAKERIANYIAEECALDPNKFKDMTLILHHVCKDFIASCSRESLGAFIDHIFESNYESFTDKIISALSLIQIRDVNDYINGFTELLLRQSEKDLSSEIIDANKFEYAVFDSSENTIIAKRYSFDEAKKVSDEANSLAYKTYVKKVKR